MARHYVAAAAVAVLVAVALASPAFAAKASLTPSVHHVRCPDQAVSAGSVFCETVTLTNTSGFTIHVDHWTLTGSDVVDFESSNSPCGASTLNPYPDAGDSCVLNVYFDPSATGHRSATAEFIESTFGSTTSVGLAGRGT